eukprot:CAMPEP_0114595470 /NCGR_PEP_ID=MMETSP0125-20121206/17266_1 /TAXON_ID=485358 ORGANISM="Aristerostoma sp., Strain ATCC 50986" /NCGR_SAMPLE_ID=MMETSP0125 /ASSEMBLY_ACC=CAM_ASM_000245 /LENGTH=60 /DNA_ID=CAMNT_0001797085 /DNA_START=983 /DNA_END=1168 /DNA_ORIENTATION=+
MASIYYANGKDEEALKMFLESVRIKEKIYGPESTHLSKTLNNIGSIYMQQGHYKLALKYF